MKNGDELINRKIPEGVPIFGFMGHSYGGELAYRMAVQWSQKHNEKPHVYLKDTDIHAGNVTPTNIEARKTTNDTKIESSDWSGTDYTGTETNKWISLFTDVAAFIWLL